MAARQDRLIENGPKALEELVNRALDLSKKARRNKKSLSGDNYYANKLVELRADATNVFRDLPVQSVGDVSAMAEMIQTVFAPGTGKKQRADTAKELIYSLLTTWRDGGGQNVIPATENVFPLSILDKTKRGYLVSIGRQMNGCFAAGWHDGCAVMLRRLLELSIIEAFENHGLTGKITDAKGDYVHLSELITKALSEPSWKLSKNTKKYTPKLRDVGHQSAHGRYFNATKDDIEKVRDGARVVIEEFLHHAGLL